MYLRLRSQALEDLADNDLIRRFKKGDDEALEVLLRRHSDDLYRFCRHLVPNQQDAEDIFQESLTRAIDRVDSLQSGSAFRGWLFRIARNLSVDSFRSRRRTCSLLDEEIAPLPVQVDGPQDHVEAGEEHQTVAQALGKLTESHQRVLVLREVEGLSYADIARRLNVSGSAVETLLFRARKRLREEYQKRNRTAPGLALLVGLRALATRLAAPVLGGTHIAAKAAVTTALLGGAAAVSMGNLAPTHLTGAKTKALVRSAPHGQAKRSPGGFGSAYDHTTLGGHMPATSMGALASRVAPRKPFDSRGTKHHLAASNRGAQSVVNGRAMGPGSMHLLALGNSQSPSPRARRVPIRSSIGVPETGGVVRTQSRAASTIRSAGFSNVSGSKEAGATSNRPIVPSHGTAAHQAPVQQAPRGNAATPISHAAAPQGSALLKPAANASLPPGQVKRALSTGSSSTPIPTAQRQSLTPSQGANHANGQSQGAQKQPPSKNDHPPKGNGKH